MIDFTVLGGYLGAGKTTLLNHILRHNDGRRFALLINDFGDINIDAQLIESQNDSQINLANGCVCCTLSDGFYEAIDSLLNLQPPPQHIIVEASGVADVHNLAQYGYGPKLRLAGIVVVADAETVRGKANDKYVAQTVRRQLKAADLIVLNKTDLCSTDALADVKAWLDTETGQTPIVPAVRCEIPVSLLFNLTPDESHNIHEHHTHEQYRSWSFHREAAIERTQIEAFMQKLPISVIRAKGLFCLPDGRVLELQIVGRRRELSIRPEETRRNSELVAIGLQDQLQPTQLDNLALHYLDGHLS